MPWKPLRSAEETAHPREDTFLPIATLTACTLTEEASLKANGTSMSFKYILDQRCPGDCVGTPKEKYEAVEEQLEEQLRAFGFDIKLNMAINVCAVGLTQGECDEICNVQCAAEQETRRYTAELTTLFNGEEFSAGVASQVPYAFSCPQGHGKYPVKNFSTGLATWAIVAIVAACIVVAITAVVTIAVCVRRQRSKPQSEAQLINNATAPDFYPGGQRQ